jgi:hypothetical protein
MALNTAAWVYREGESGLSAQMDGSLDIASDIRPQVFAPMGLLPLPRLPTLNGRLGIFTGVVVFERLEDEMFRLERPNMAVNDNRVSGDGSFRRFRMWHTWDIDATETCEQIAERVATVARGATGGKLKHLVLSGHGHPGFLQLGQGIDRSKIPLFAAWSGLIEKIWLPNCLIARIPDAAMPAIHYHGLASGDGNVFCGELARTVRCHVVAATETQCDFMTDVPPDMMTSFEGLVLSYGPAGNVTWSSRNRSMWMRTDPDTGASQCVPVPN